MLGYSHPAAQFTSPSWAPASGPVVVYGRRWCGLSQSVRRYLDRAGIPYRYVDLDLNPHDETRLAWVTGGRVHSPIVSIGGQMLVQPTIGELERALRSPNRQMTTLI
ncbi:glutaredoxin family protein [Kribbella sp. NPDC006257]|uniref:glutaredoxin family protein n=1 Tax=Kribbella sp. NPDC006257 TaxID=3156738 RepID=UPI0033AD8648